MAFQNLYDVSFSQPIPNTNDRVELSGSEISLTSFSGISNATVFAKLNTYPAKKKVKIYNLWVFVTSYNYTGVSIFDGSVPTYPTVGQYNSIGRTWGTLREWIINISGQYSPQTFLTFSGYGSANPPYVLADVLDIIPKVQNLYPTDFVATEEPAAFKWEFYAETPTDGVKLVQTSALIEWQEAEGSTVHQVSVLGPASEYTFPADTFPSGTSFRWRIKVTSDDGVDSEWSSWQTVSTTEPAGAVSNIFPSNMIVDGDNDVTVSWNYSSVYGLSSTGYDIEFSTDNSAWLPAASSTETAATSAVVPAGTFPSGNVTLRVRAYNSTGAVSEWASAVITVRKYPPTPSIYDVNATVDKPTVYWSSSEQAAYHLTLTDSAGITLVDEYVTGSARSRKIPRRLDDGTYTVKLRIINTYGMEGKEGSREFTVATDKPDKPIIGVSLPLGEIDVTGGLKEVYDDKVTLVFGGTTDRAVLLRDGMAIADVSSLAEYTDYTAPRRCEYRLRSLATDSFCDSEPVTVELTCRHSTIASVDVPKELTKLMLRAKSAVGNSVTDSSEFALLTFAGRKYPLAEVGEHKNRVKRLNYSVTDEKSLQALKSLCGTPVIWRDRHEKMTAVMSELSYTRHQRYVDVSFSLTQIDYTEEITYE